MSQAETKKKKRKKSLYPFCPSCLELIIIPNSRNTVSIKYPSQNKNFGNTVSLSILSVHLGSPVAEKFCLFDVYCYGRRGNKSQLAYAFIFTLLLYSRL